MTVFEWRYNGLKVIVQRYRSKFLSAFLLYSLVQYLLFDFYRNPSPWKAVNDFFWVLTQRQVAVFSQTDNDPLIALMAATDSATRTTAFITGFMTRFERSTSIVQLLLTRSVDRHRNVKAEKIVLWTPMAGQQGHTVNTKTHTRADFQNFI